MEAGLPCHVDDGVGIDQLHIIVLVLLRQGFGQDLDGLCIAGIGMIEEGIVRVGGGLCLERRGISVIAIDAHVVARQRLADDEDVDTVRRRFELRGKDAILDRHMAALLHHRLEIGEAGKRLIGLIIHMREPRRPDRQTAETDIHKEEQRHRPPRLSGYGKAAIEGETAAVEDEPREDEDRKRPQDKLGIRDIHIDILLRLGKIRLRKRQQHIDGDQRMRDEVVAHIRELDAHIKEHQDDARDACDHAPFPRQDPCRREAGDEQIERRRELA